ncbi:MAG TPA: hypothetical protein VKB62_03685 [Streptosporangiaceae bacterium]|nr:hypothetical protein [Streptosporangiaceae bacterium]
MRTAVTAGWAGPGGPSRQRPGAVPRRATLGEATAATLGERAFVGVALGERAFVGVALWQSVSTLRQSVSTLRQAAALRK